MGGPEKPRSHVDLALPWSNVFFDDVFGSAKSLLTHLSFFGVFRMYRLLTCAAICIVISSFVFSAPAFSVLSASDAEAVWGAGSNCSGVKPNGAFGCGSNAYVPGEVEPPEPESPCPYPAHVDDAGLPSSSLKPCRRHCYYWDTEQSKVICCGSYPATRFCN